MSDLCELDHRDEFEPVNLNNEQMDDIKGYKKLQNRIKELEEALLYYANFEDNRGEFGEYGNLVGTVSGDIWERDCGSIAQKALEQK